MPRFFFHLHECGEVTPDEEGCELPDLEAAHVRAVEAARDVMAGEVRYGALCLDCSIRIADARGEPLMRVLFRDALAVSGRRPD